jgi:hypothetical protein
MDKTTYRVTWWPTENAPEGMKINTKRRHQDVLITPEYETTFEDIRKIIAVSRSGRPSDAQYVHVFAVVQIEGAM